MSMNTTVNDRIAAALSDLANTTIAHCKAQLADAAARSSASATQMTLADAELAERKAKGALSKLISEQVAYEAAADWTL